MQSNDKLDIDEMNRLMHDLKLPITVIQSISETVKKLNQQEVLVSYLYMLDRNIRYMTRIIDGIKETVNRYEDLEGEEFFSDFIGYSESILDTVKPVCDLRNIEVDFQSEEDYFEVSLNWSYYERIVYNVLQNSIKHAKNCTLIQVIVKIEENNINVTITDDGKNLTNESKQDETKVDSQGEGFFIITSLARKLNSTIEHYFTKQGMFFSIDIPIEETQITRQMGI